MEDVLITNRLLLREINDSDTADIVKWRSDEHVFRFFKSPHRITQEEHVAWYNNIYKKDNTRIDYICIEKKSEKKIGVFGLIHKNTDVEINYLLSPDAQHNGYAKEAVECLIQHANSMFNATRIFAEIHKENIPSINLIKKLGFRIESEDESFVIYTNELS